MPNSLWFSVALFLWNAVLCFAFLKDICIYIVYVVHINLFLRSEIQEASQLLVLRAEMFLYCLVQIPMA